MGGYFEFEQSANYRWRYSMLIKNLRDRKDLKYPPTAVGGITNLKKKLFGSKDLNESAHLPWGSGVIVVAQTLLGPGGTKCL